MGLTAQLNPLTLPLNTEFPPTPQSLLTMIAQYMEITGLEDFNGVNYGPVTPSEDNRDKPWFKTDESFNPIGWYSWNGAAWTPIPVVIPSGSTDNRPGAPIDGQEYLDTDIHVTLIYERSQWRTLAGSPGDVKAVKATTLVLALLNNPGWSQDPDSTGRVIAGAEEDYSKPADIEGPNDTFSYPDHAYGTKFGEEGTSLLEDQNATHDHNFQSGTGTFPGQFQNGVQAAGVFPITTGLAAGSTGLTAEQGSGLQHNTLQPTVFYWYLVKD